MATPDSSGVQRRRVRSDGKLIRPQNHRASRPVNRPCRNPPTGVATCTIRSPISIGASRFQRRRRYRRIERDPLGSAQGLSNKNPATPISKMSGRIRKGLFKLS
jgi:hypothetical protein